MIVGAAVCPCPPLLVRELTGQAEVLPELRAACAAAVARLTAAAPDVIAVAGPGEETAVWPANGRLDLAAFAPALGRSGRSGQPGRPGRPGRPEKAAGAAPSLPLSLGIGARLLDEAGYAGPRAFRGIDALAGPAACLHLGRQIAASAPRVALLAVGDGSARRSVSAPGYLDERAAPFDASVERAVRDGDLAALAALNPALAADLMVTGRAAWQVLAGALAGQPDEGRRGGSTQPARPATEILYSEAPLGVAYLVATFSPR